MKESIIKLIDDARKALHALTQYLQGCYQNLRKRQKEQEKQQKQFDRANRIARQQDEVQIELAEVLKNFNYQGLARIDFVGNLRQDGYKIQNGQIIYFFSIDKTTRERLPCFAASAIRQTMNKDIFFCQRNLASTLSSYEIMQLYPALHFGLRVIGIQEQPPFIRLAVVTNMPL